MKHQRAQRIMQRMRDRLWMLLSVWTVYLFELTHRNVIGNQQEMK